MKTWIVTIVESARIDALVSAENKTEARRKAQRGEYDKMIETAIPVTDKIEHIKEAV